MTRADYIAALLLLLRLFEGTLTRDDSTRDHNYIQMVRTLEMFLPNEVIDGDITSIRTMSGLYLDRIQRLFLTPNKWTRQTELTHEWVVMVLALTQEN